MNTFTVTATNLKQNFSDILNRVYYEKKIALVERHGKVIARLTPEEKTSAKKEIPAEAWERFGGSLPDFPNVTKFRRNKRKWRTFTL